MSEPLVIVGASVRAAATSARRCGFDVIGVDLFADLDLCEVARAERIARYPVELLARLPVLPDGPWMYTGGLENHPRLVDRLATRRKLWGNAGRALRAVRDPMRLAEVLGRHGLAMPETRPATGFATGIATGGRAPDDPPAAGDWLGKTGRGSGGSGVVAPQTGQARYWQRRVRGTPIGMAYVAAAGSGSLLGVTRQLVGEAWCGGAEFAWCGSVGPLELDGPFGMDGPLEAECRRLGDVVASEFGLTGLFGIDAILADGRPWVVEVNPRYPASLEVLERTLGGRMLALHAEACGGECPSSPGPDRAPSAGPVAGKAILYAPHDMEGDLVVTADWVARAVKMNAGRAWPLVADIPPAGTVMRSGRPVCTLLESGPTSDAVAARLRERAAAMRAEWASAQTSAVFQSRPARLGS